jgi:SET domain-containing protein
VATYSGNVLYLAQVAKLRDNSIKDYLFHLISGHDVRSTFVVYPKEYESAGFFMNHADSKRNKKEINVKTLIAIHKSGPIVLMQASKKINYGDELLYNYNGEYDSFDTKDFE